MLEAGILLKTLLPLAWIGISAEHWLMASTGRRVETSLEGNSKVAMGLNWASQIQTLKFSFGGRTSP